MMTLAVCSLYISKHSQTFSFLLLFLAAYKAPQSFIFVLFFFPSFVCLFVYFFALRIYRLLEFFFFLF